MTENTVTVTAYTEWIREQAALIHADGCTGVTNWNGVCCLQHDLEYFHGKSAVAAYQLASVGDPDPWGKAKPVTFEQANAHFKACNFRESALGYFNLFAWVRYAARLKMRAAWDSHRQRETTVTTT